MSENLQSETGNGRFMFVVHTLDDRGVARVIKAITANLASRGVDVSIVCAVWDETAPNPPANDVPVINLDIGHHGTLFAVPGLARALRRHRPSVIIAHGPGPNRAAVIARILAGVSSALILVEHIHSSAGATRHGPAMGRIVRTGLERLLYPRAERVAGVSPGVVTDIARRNPTLGPRLRVLPNPLPIAAAGSRKLELTQPCASRFESGPTITCVANLIPRKGQLLLIEALAMVRQRIPRVGLVLVGRPDDPAYLEQLHSATGRLKLNEAVCFAGFQADPMPYLASSDVVALPSYQEGFALALLEAMACGTPVVATDCPSGPAYLLEGGRHGILTPVGDAVALAEGLVQVLSDPELAARLANSALDRAREFRPTAVADSYLQLAREAIEVA